MAFSKLPVMMSDEDVVDKRYENGKIYVVKCKYDDTLVYVGSTIQNLCNRMSMHRYTKNKCMLYKYVNETNDDWDNWFIELYENYPCKNKYHLERREGEIQREIATINKCIAGRSKKEWYEDNKHKDKERKQKYQLEYYEKNSDIYKDKQRQYRKDNLIEIREKDRQNIKTCERCGCIITKHISRHQKTQKCLNYNVANK